MQSIDLFTGIGKVDNKGVTFSCVSIMCFQGILAHSDRYNGHLSYIRPFLSF